MGPVIYLVEQAQTANQNMPTQDAVQKSLPHATESLRSNGSIAPFAATTVVNPEPSVVSSDPVMIVIAIAGATAAFFAVFLGMRAFAKLRKIKK